MTKKLDALGDRMKAYEGCYRLFIPKKSLVVIRLDGVAFHTFTKGLERPFDADLMADMDETTKFLCEKISGVKIGYVQSDEISLVLSDRDTLDTEPWFGNNLQKLCSVSAAMCTAKFNQLRIASAIENPPCDEDGNIVSDSFEGVVMAHRLAYFDARVFVLPNEAEVYNYLQWRSNDASRNSVSSVAQSLYSHKELHGKSNSDKQELIFQKGINWNDYTYRQKRGGTFARIPAVSNADGVEVPACELCHDLNNGTEFADFTFRKKWKAVETPMKWYEERERFPL
jgi:tRNA(His) guanylyltransferase